MVNITKLYTTLNAFACILKKFHNYAEYWTSLHSLIVKHHHAYIVRHPSYSLFSIFMDSFFPRPKNTSLEGTRHENSRRHHRHAC